MKNVPTTEPRLTGRAGRAWEFEPNNTPEGAALLASYLVERPGTHPAWDGWTVSVVSLREFPQIAKSIRHYPGAEYEFLIASLNPDHDAPTLDWSRPPRYLQPIDVVKQFHGLSDAQACQICELAVKAIVEGVVSPDQDARREWEVLIENTVEHVREGKHPESEPH